MAAGWNDIHTWLVEAKAEGATHVLIVCDTYDWTDYPVSVQPGEKVEEQIEKYHGKSMQKVMEVYNLSLDIETQLRQHKVWNL